MDDSGLVVIFRLDPDPPRNPHARSGTVHDQITGIGVTVRQGKVALDLVEGQSLAKDIGKVERQSARQRGDTEQSDRAARTRIDILQHPILELDGNSTGNRLGEVAIRAATPIEVKSAVA